jgi:GT2 family glycosyltransferase
MAEVSVITPVRDGAAFLGEAIASVQAQTVGDWEMLIVDDGSHDGSAELAAEAARADPRIRLMAAAARRGAAAARNLGLAAARGDVVALLDADDVYEPDKLAVDLAAMADHPEAAMVYGPTLWWWPDEDRPPRVERMPGLAGRLHAPPQLFLRVLVGLGADVPCTCAVTMRRAAVEAVGGFEEAFSLYEDQTLWAKLMLRWPVYVHGVPTSRYRQHAGSTSARAERDGRYHPQRPHAARAEFLTWAGREAEAAGRATPALRRAIRLALAAYPEQGPGLTALDRGVLLKRRLEARLRR